MTKETLHYDEKSGLMFTKLEWDSEPLLKMNHAHRRERPEHGRYKGNLVHVGRMDIEDVERLRNMGYDLLSPDPDERRRALMYIQSNEKYLLTVPGKPFARKRIAWT